MAVLLLVARQEIRAESQALLDKANEELREKRSRQLELGKKTKKAVTNL
jgi:hypothetical protein